MPNKKENPNPIQYKYENKFDANKSAKYKVSSNSSNSSNIEEAEKNGTMTGSTNKTKQNKSSDINNVKNAEESPDKGWKNNVTGTGGGGRGNNTSSTGGSESDSTGSNTGSTKSNISISLLKKKGPLLAIILTIFGGGVGIVGLASPSIVLVQIKEIMVNKFNAQFSSMDIRTTKMLTTKMGTTKGLCSLVVSAKCRYSTMSEKQIKNFKKAGITVISDGNKNLLGRTKPKSLKFEGKTITAGREFNAILKNNTKFRAAIRVAYNPKFAGFADNIWKYASGKLGISKTAADISGKTENEKLAKIQERTKNPAAFDPATADQWPDGKLKDDGVTAYTPAEIDAHNAAARIASETANSLSDTTQSAMKSAPSVLAGATSVINALKITGWMDNACTVYGAMRALGYAAKTVRAVQLARYAMIFLNVADQIKAGTAKAKDVAYLGKIVTTEVAASATSVKLGTATNSFGYRFAAYGKGGTMSDTASQYLAGGGLAGKLIKITSMINSTLGGTPRRTCGILNNPFVSVGSLLAGLALFIVPGGAPFNGWRAAAQVAAGMAFSVAAAYLPALLKDIVAGVLVDKSTVGEAAGEAIASGASGIMGTTAQSGGNAPLTPAQAVAYSNLTKNILAQYAEEDRLTYSPLDASNSNTFMGKIVAQLVPYASNMSSLSGALSSVASLTTGSFASLTSQTANASSLADFTMCQDYDYNDIKGNDTDIRVATDPYCNVTYGIPPEALTADPIDAIDDLIASGDIDPETGDAIGDNYTKFLENCINRTRPMGDSGQDNRDSDGSECLFGEKVDGTTFTNKNYYIHYIDQRVQAGLDDEEGLTDSTIPDDPITPDPIPTDTPFPTPPELTDLKLDDWVNNHAKFNCVTNCVGTAVPYRSDFKEFLQLMGGDVFVTNLLNKYPTSMLDITSSYSGYAESSGGNTKYNKHAWNTELDRRVSTLMHEYVHHMDDGAGAKKYYDAAKAKNALQWDNYAMINKAEYIASGFEWVVKNDPFDKGAGISKRSQLRRIDSGYYKYLVTDFIPWMYKPH
jgi:hypothetical protein